jgi:hypothetical protein
MSFGQKLVGRLPWLKAAHIPSPNVAPLRKEFLSRKKLSLLLKIILYNTQSLQVLTINKAYQNGNFIQKITKSDQLN